MKIVLPEKVTYIIDTLTQHGFEAYAVGGCVRDTMLGRIPMDWDITTSAKPEQVKELFRHTIDTGIQHGTVTVMLEHEGFEVTTYRIDGEYEDARHPKEVQFTSNLLEDLKRRDFTINAMAYNDKDGLVDAFDGVGDLERGVIRCVGAAVERFTEDALRMLRAVRFGAQLGFSIEDETRGAIVSLAPNIAKVSAERVQIEMVKLLTSGHPELLRTAYETGLTAVFLPEFDEMMKTPQNNPHHKYNVGIHTIEAMKQIEAEHIYRWTMLLHDVGKPTARVEGPDKDHFKMHPVIGEEMARKILRRLKFDNQTIKQVTTLVRWHDRRFASIEEVNKKTVRRWVSQLTPELFTRLMEVQKADISAQSDYQRDKKEQVLQETKKLFEEIIEEKNCLSIKELKINGKDLMDMGVPQGKEIGQILSWLLDQVLEDPQLNERETLTQMAEEKRDEK